MIDTDLQKAHMLMRACVYATQKTLVDCGKIKATMSISEAYRASSRNVVDRAVQNGFLKLVKKGGKTSKKYFVREDFYKWLTIDELYNEPVTPKKDGTN